jgi:hypothetical protein
MNLFKDSLNVLKDYLSWLFDQQPFRFALVIVTVISLNRCFQDMSKNGDQSWVLTFINSIKGLFV